MPNIDEYTRTLITFIVEYLAELQVEEYEATATAIYRLDDNAGAKEVALARDNAVARLWQQRQERAGAIADAAMAVADPNFETGPTPRTSTLWALQQKLQQITATAAKTAPIKLWVVHPDGMQDDLAIAADVVTAGAASTCHIMVAAAESVQVTLSRRDDGNVWAMNMSTAGTGVRLKPSDGGVAHQVRSAHVMQPGDTLLVGASSRDGKRKATRIKLLP